MMMPSSNRIELTRYCVFQQNHSVSFPHIASIDRTSPFKAARCSPSVNSVKNRKKTGNLSALRTLGRTARFDGSVEVKRTGTDVELPVVEVRSCKYCFSCPLNSSDIPIPGGMFC